MQAAQIRKVLEDSPIAGETKRIMAFVRPALRIQSYLAEDDNLPLGASRMGGGPDLPPGAPWPQNHGRPIEFLAQIDLAEATQAATFAGLPDHGWLLVFCDIERMYEGKFPESGGWRLAHFEAEAASLERRDYPGEAADSFNLCELAFAREDCLPNLDDLVPGDLLGDDTWDVCQELDTKINKAGRGDPVHRLYGQAGLIQGRAKDYDGWDLLLQIDTDEEVGWMWGDMGRLYFWSKQENPIVRAVGNAFSGRLHARIGAQRRWARRLASAWCDYQCY